MSLACLWTHLERLMYFLTLLSSTRVPLASPWSDSTWGGNKHKGHGAVNSGLPTREGAGTWGGGRWRRRRQPAVLLQAAKGFQGWSESFLAH